MLTLQLASIPSDKCKGIYGPDKNKMPARALYLAPLVARSFLLISQTVIVSDMFRSPESSLAAIRADRGAKSPGFSGHNYGLAIDLDVKNTLRQSNFSGKEALDSFMQHNGWYCHRRDHLTGKSKMHPNDESWHYNFLGPGVVISPRVNSTSGYIEAEIQKHYGDKLKLSSTQIQECLKKLRLYSGELDGAIGPISKEAIRVFQRAWGIDETGKPDLKTQRTLAYVSADRQVDGKLVA